MAFRAADDLPSGHFLTVSEPTFVCDERTVWRNRQYLGAYRSGYRERGRLGDGRAAIF